jgi:hypothetical protein
MTKLLAILAVAWPFGLELPGHQDPAPSVVKAAVDYLSRELVKLPVTLDPRVLAAAPGLPKPEGNSTHSASLLASSATVGRSTVSTLELAVACRIPVAAACKTNGYAVFAMLGRPVVTGDSARITIWVRSARDLTSKDSADIRALHVRREALMRQASYRGAPFNIYDSTQAFDRLEQPSLKLVEFTLALTRGEWRVTSSKYLLQS